MTTIRPLIGKQLLAVRYSTARVNVYEGSVRSSKTVTSLIDWIRYCRNGPPGALLMTGRTERTVINNLVLPILDMLGPHRVKINLGNGTVNICGRNVILIGANNESARTKIQVPRPDFAGSPHHIRTATEAVDQHPHIGNTGCSAARWIPPGRKSDQRQKGTFT